MNVNLLCLDQEPILNQLQIEEALLRVDSENWCIINRGSSPAIVMGISGKPESLIDIERYQKHPIPVIRRFSGGGTVVVDENTLFISFIFSKKSLDFGMSSQEVLRWSEEFYKPVFLPHPFVCQENDYTIAERKIGGNAHYFTKERWLHHTTFLWDYNPQLMALLQFPEKRPEYRLLRSHEEFITRLQLYYPSIESLVETCIFELGRHFSVTERTKEECLAIMHKPHRKSLEVIQL